METIKSRQETIIEEFSLLDDDLELTLDYIMELGNELASFPEEKRTEENIVKGCQSKVWMTAIMEGDKVKFQADSNTAITKGLVSLLVRVLNQSTPKNILDAELYFPEQIGMNRFIGTQRSNGFSAMIKQMKLFALAFTVKENQ
jgi:cysteine desulfuration protein SufE